MKQPDYLYSLSGRRRFRRFNSFGARLGIIVLAITIVVFASYQLFFLARGPQIVFADDVSLSGYNTASNNIFTLRGTTDRVAYLFLNGIEQPTNLDGGFEFDLYLPYGSSTIEVVIRDRYGRTKTQTLLFNNPAENLSITEREAKAQELLSDYRQ